MHIYEDGFFSFQCSDTEDWFQVDPLLLKLSQMSDDVVQVVKLLFLDVSLIGK